MIYWILALATYVYLCCAINKTIAPIVHRSTADYDEALLIMIFGYLLAVVAAVIWPVTLLVAIPTHFYIHKQQKTPGRFL